MIFDKTYIILSLSIFFCASNLFAQEYIFMTNSKLSAAQRQILQGGERRQTLRQLCAHPFIYKSSGLPLKQLKAIKPLGLQRDIALTYRSRVPDDFDTDRQWPLLQIEAPDAWEYSTGGITNQGDTIVVAVIDRSFNITHEDLQGNIWSNPNEIPNDGIDNDNNGKIDDVNGWNIIANNNDLSNNSDINNHGNAILGIIGARGDNATGGTGINWTIKMLPISAGNANQVLLLSNIIESFGYCLNLRRSYNKSNGAEGAFITSINMSWGIDFEFADTHPVWCAMYDSLGQVGILSVAATTNLEVNIDTQGDMPASCRSNALLVVNENNQDDNLNDGTGTGVIGVDLSAPGATRTTYWSGYKTFGGTSGATPHVTGAIALLYSLPNARWAAYIKEQPADAALLIKSLLMEYSTKKESYLNKTQSGGRLNIGATMEALDAYFSTPQESDLIYCAPNPFKDYIRIKMQFTTTKKASIRFINKLGQIVYTASYTPKALGTRTIELPIKKLPSGSYWIEILYENKRHIKQLIHQQ